MALRSLREVLPALLAKKDPGEQEHCSRLWSHWDMVMGRDIAPLAHPLGHRKETLLLGADDPMAAQELSMMIPEILERANAFMDGPFFTRVQVEQRMRRPSLAEIAAEQARPAPVTRIPRPEHLGGLLGSLDPASPVGRCYAAYVSFFSR